MKIVASFVHGYNDLNVSQPDLPRPLSYGCKWKKKVNIKKYIFQEILVTSIVSKT